MFTTFFNCDAIDELKCVGGGQVGDMRCSEGEGGLLGTVGKLFVRGGGAESYVSEPSMDLPLQEKWAHSPFICQNTVLVFTGRKEGRAVLCSGLKFVNL